MPTSPEIVAHIDGGSRGNPGPAAYGVAIETAHGERVAAFGKYIGRTTNNVAEYQGLLAALAYALDHGHPVLRVLTDSELMARQISGHYKVRSPDLKPLYDKALALIAQMGSFSIRHVYREQNREADRLANEAMDRGERGIAPSPPARPTPSAVTPGPPTLEANGSQAPLPNPVAATFQNGVLRPHKQISLFDGEEVELEIRRKK